MSKNNDEKSQPNLSTEEGIVCPPKTSFSNFKKTQKSKSKNKPQKPSDKKS